MADKMFEKALDFYDIQSKNIKADRIEVYPDYVIDEDVNDLMVRGGSFYAVWDPDRNRWNRKETTVKRIVDRDVKKYVELIKDVSKSETMNVNGKYLRNNSSRKWAEFKTYINNLPDAYTRLDEIVSFQDPNDSSIAVDYKGKRLIKREDHISRSLPFSIQIDGECPAWNELISTLYEPEERDKIEWAIGSVISGDSKKIQKFLVLYGKQGTGKGTILGIIEKMFDGYCSTFKAENLVHSGDNFNLDFLSEDPLIAIDADTNLSRIESNVLINQIVSHERIKVNEKFKNKYPNKPICMLFLGTNQEVRITDAKSGIIRRLIDVEPSERLIPEEHYFELMDQIEYEYGAIAGHCLKVYKELGRTYYSDYIPVRMMYRSDPFFNFMEDVVYDYIKAKDVAIANGENIYEGISASDLWKKWTSYCIETGITHTRKRFEIIDEAKNYFEHYCKDQKRVRGADNPIRGLFTGFKYEKFHQGDSDQVKTRRERKNKAKNTKENEPKKESTEEQKFSYGWLNLNCTESIFDKEFAEYSAQYDTGNLKHPLKYSWNENPFKLKDLDTSKVHWLKGPGQLIFVDFDKHDAEGKKNLDLNMKAVIESGLPKTYTELSNSGGGLHSYYWYDGDINDLSSIFDSEIEVKKFPEDKNLSIRRRVSRCNDLPIAHISSGLPFKEKKKVVNYDGLKDEQHLRNLIKKIISKDVRPYDQEPKTVTCMKMLTDVLKQAQANNMSYDIRDLEELIYAFAANSSNNKQECIGMFYDLEFLWPKVKEPVGSIFTNDMPDNGPIIILDCEVIKNLTLVVYKELEPDNIAGVFKKDGPVKKCVRLYNPKPYEIERLINSCRIVGHNVVKYDNYILAALMYGYSPEQIAEISNEIINKENREIYKKFRDAKNISYTDTLDVASEKKGLKKIELEMHIPHKEMEIDWSKPLPEKDWETLAQYCENDVLATEAYFLSKKWQTDFKARKILAALTGMTVNDSTNNLVAQLLFGDVREPQVDFIYPDLKKEFPPYSFENGKSYYRQTVKVSPNDDFQAKLDEFEKNKKEWRVISSDILQRTIEVDAIIGEGGRVYAEPGMYYGVVTFDVTSMHPTSIIVENGFGPYTKAYQELYEARVAIKNKDYEKARKLFGGRLAPYLENDDDADDLGYALKIALNSTYGVTAAHFQNRFKDPRNVDNWVAKRGACFMEKLRLEVQKRGGHVIHIKTDSIKLVQPSKELQDFVMQFAKDHGYSFKIESRYERICLVNNAVYIALRDKEDEEWLKECKKAKEAAEKHETPYIEPTRWTATGAQFAHPFVFKQLFSHQQFEFWDFCEMKTVKTALYLDMNEKLPDVEQHEKEKKKIQTRIRKILKDSGILESSVLDADKLKVEQIDNEIKDLQKDIQVLDELIAKGHNYVFVGKAGEFIPVKPGFGGGLLVRSESDSDNFGFATGAKGYRWVESESLQNNENWKRFVDIRYFRSLADAAIESIGKYGDFGIFAKEGSVKISNEFDDGPWNLPCKTEEYAYCSDCPDFTNDESGYSCKKGYNISNQILGE